MTSRRTFLAQVGAGTAASLLDVDELRAGTVSSKSCTWDTSWIDKLKAAEHRVVSTRPRSARFSFRPASMH